MTLWEAMNATKTVNKSAHEVNLLPTIVFLLEMHQSLLPMRQNISKMLAGAVGSFSC
jgi:hypothetical protein